MKNKMKSEKWKVKNEKIQLIHEIKRNRVLESSSREFWSSNSTPILLQESSSVPELVF
jgi:hypothetical protein